MSTPATQQGLSDEECQELAKAINALPNDRKKGLVQIIRDSPTYTGDKMNIRLNVSEMDPATQKQLRDYAMS